MMNLGESVRVDSRTSVKAELTRPRSNAAFVVCGLRQRERSPRHLQLEERFDIASLEANPAPRRADRRKPSRFLPPKHGVRRYAEKLGNLRDRQKTGHVQLRCVLLTGHSSTPARLSHMDQPAPCGQSSRLSDVETTVDDPT